MIDMGKDLQQAFEDGYKKGFADGQSQPTIQPQGIDKDRLIEEFKKELAWIESYCVRDEDRYIEGAMGGLAKAIELVNQQPTTDGWIPVSERLPEEDMWCLITYQSGGVEKVKYCTSDNWGQNDEHIIAWQPLPPAYKESGSCNNCNDHKESE